jgi:hypothetical protein
MPLSAAHPNRSLAESASGFFVSLFSRKLGERSPAETE